MSEQRATLFLHIDELDDATKEKMVEAGYLPIKVKDLNAYRTVSHSLSLSRDQIDAIGAAALEALVLCGSDSAREEFVNNLARRLGVTRDP